jgi:hypothetical protein
VQAGGQPDEFDVFEDSQNNILDVLANDDPAERCREDVD